MEDHLARERRERWFDSMVPALCGSRSWEKLFDLLETTPFLAQQAELSRGFLRGLDTLERHVLPALIELGDWERFLRHAATAVNFRGLAESLAGGEVLRALATNGHVDWAVNLVEQIPDSAQRRRCRVMVAAALPQDDSRRYRLLREVAAKLSEAELPERSAAEAWCAELEETASALGFALRSSWKTWADRLADWPDLADRVRRAAAESFFERLAPEDRRLWELLAGITSADILASFLPGRLAEAAPEDFELLLERVRALPAGGECLAWLVRAAILGRRAASDLSGACEAWFRAAAASAVPWSVKLVEAGTGLWLRLSDQELDTMAADVADPTCRVALRVLALDRSCSPGREAAALEAVTAMPPGLEQLHWTLRCLAAMPAEPRRVGVVLERLHNLRYRVPDEDVRRALDLTAEVLPQDLRRQVEDVLWSSAGRTGTLLALVESAASLGLLRELFERAESYAAAVASSQAEGFELRRKVLVRLACRLCRFEESLQPAERAAERLLPEEEDELLLKVAAGLSQAQPHLAAEAARRIRSPALQLRALLSVLPPGEELDRRLSPESLYRAGATVDILEDELRALSALREPPVRPEELAQRHLEGIRRPSRRIEALVDLAWHALRYQERAFSPARRDLLAAVLPLKQALGVVESDAWLLGITPELAEVGAELGVANAVAEFQEAADRIVRLDSVPWPARAEALLNLIARVQPVLLARGRAGANRYGATATLLDWLADLPERADSGPGRDELRQHWHEIFPWLMAAVRRMPEEVRAFLASPVQARLSWHLGRLAPRLPGSFRTRWSEERLDPFLAGWEWLSPHQVPALEAGWWALTALLACEAPTGMPDMVRRLLTEEHGSLGWSFLRNGWLPPEVSRQLIEALPEPSRDWGQVWLGLAFSEAEGETPWVQALADLVGDSALEPADPAVLPIRRRLRVLDGDEVLQALGIAAVAALRSGGRRGGEVALCLFLNAYLPFRSGEAAAAAIRSSLTLPGGNGSDPARDFHDSARKREGPGFPIACPAVGGPAKVDEKFLAQGHGLGMERFPGEGH